mgnify:CR=1 FL=1
MSEEKLFVSAWLRFDIYRQQVIALMRELELSELNQRYTIRSEADVRKRLSDAALLLDKMLKELGPPSKPPTNVT